MKSTPQHSIEQIDQVARNLRIEAGLQCPQCDSPDTEDNGSLEYRCCNCDHRWGREGGRDGEPYGY